MPLNLMYITNNPRIAGIVERSGVDRIFIDMEQIGKEIRQGGMDTVKSHHTVEDVIKVKDVLTKSKLLVRVNPIHEKSSLYMGSKAEIDSVISAGADIVMLPMYKTEDEVKRFIDYVDGRARVLLLTETKEAAENIDNICQIPGIDEIHIGLNDLHLSYGKKFMFELLSEGLVEKLCTAINKNGIFYGFGGIARLGYGIIPSEKIIAEHYRLGSGMAILSRSFCNAEKISDMDLLEESFTYELARIREYEGIVEGFSKEKFEENRIDVVNQITKYVENI